MDAPTDVLVVGAGPAGSVTALVLARAGVRVRMVDRATFPRDKLCGDTVNPGSLALLDHLGLGAAVRARAVPVTGMLVTGPNGAHASADYPRGLAGAALTRRHFDECLADAAIAAGAAFDDGVRVSRASVTDGNRVDGVWVTRNGRDSLIPARLVVAADGRASRLGQQLGISQFARAPRRWAFGAYFEGVEELTGRGEMHVRGWGYLGIAPLANGIANVCAVTEAARARGTQTVARASGRPTGSRYDERLLHDAIAHDPALCDRFAHARRVSPVSVLGPLAVETTGAGRAGLLLAGDAAGFIDPMTGDGLRFALQGAILAAEHAQRALETGIPQHARLLQERQHAFAGKWRINRALRTLVGSPASVGIAAAVASLWSAPVEALIGLAGDVALAHRYAVARPEGDTARVVPASDAGGATDSESRHHRSGPADAA